MSGNFHDQNTDVCKKTFRTGRIRKKRKNRPILFCPINNRYQNECYFLTFQISLALKRTVRDYLKMAKQNEENRLFVKQSTEFVLNQKFDGLDLIWDFSIYQWVPMKFFFSQREALVLAERKKKPNNLQSASDGFHTIPGLFARTLLFKSLILNSSLISVRMKK